MLPPKELIFNVPPASLMLRMLILPVPPLEEMPSGELAVMMMAVLEVAVVVIAVAPVPS